MRHHFHPTLLAVALLCGPTSAQSFNIDFEFVDAGTNNGAPPASYGAALLQQGTWNSVQFNAAGILQVLPGPAFNLVQTSGASTPVTVALTMPTPVPAGIGATVFSPGIPFSPQCPTPFPPGAPQGCYGWGCQDIALYDGVVLQDPPDGTQVIYEITFNNVVPGVYTMFTYAKCAQPEQGGPLPFTIVDPNVPGVLIPARVITNRCPGHPAIHTTPGTFVGHVLTVPSTATSFSVRFSTIDVFWQQFCLSAIQLRYLGNVGNIGSNYCVANPNSTGMAASIGALATSVPFSNPPSASAGANDLLLTGTGLVPNESCLFIYSSNPLLNWTPLRDGFLCVGTPFLRMQAPKAGIDGSGATFIPVDNTVYPGLTPGSTLYFQLWYSDPGGVTGENLSDAIQVTFGP